MLVGEKQKQVSSPLIAQNAFLNYIFFSGNVSEIKLKLIINGVSLAKCNEVYNTKQITISAAQICAGGDKGLDSCRGDSGGPLMSIEIVSGAPYWYLVGIVSFGPNPCGKEDWPGVYTKVGSYVDWIESKLVY